MKKELANQKQNISKEQLFNFFSREAKMATDKIESRKKVMKEQMDKVTGGKNILVLNKGAN